MRGLAATSASARRVRFAEPLSRHTSFRIGGPADAWVEVAERRRDPRPAARSRARSGVPLVGARHRHQRAGQRSRRARHRPQARPRPGALEWRTRATRVARARRRRGAVQEAGDGRGRAAASPGSSSPRAFPGSIGGGLLMNAGAFGGEISHVRRPASPASTPASGERCAAARRAALRLSPLRSAAGPHRHARRLRARARRSRRDPRTHGVTPSASATRISRSAARTPARSSRTRRASIAGRLIEAAGPQGPPRRRRDDLRAARQLHRQRRRRHRRRREAADGRGGRHRLAARAPSAWCRRSSWSATGSASVMPRLPLRPSRALRDGCARSGGPRPRRGRSSVARCSRAGGAGDRGAGHGAPRRAAGRALREHPYFAISQLVISGVRPGADAGRRARVARASPASRRCGTRRRRASARASRRTPTSRTRRCGANSPVGSRSSCASGSRRRSRCSTISTTSTAAARPSARCGHERQPRLPAHHRPRRRHAGRAAHLGAAPRAAPAAPLRARAPLPGELSEVHLDRRARRRALSRQRRACRSCSAGAAGATKLERAERALHAWQGAAERLASVDVRFRNQVVLHAAAGAGRRRRRRRRRGRRGRGIKA